MDSGYLPGPNALYSVGENIAYGSLQDATRGVDRGGLDGLAGAPRQHPQLVLP